MIYFQFIMYILGTILQERKNNVGLFINRCMIFFLDCNQTTSIPNSDKIIKNANYFPEFVLSTPLKRKKLFVLLCGSDVTFSSDVILCGGALQCHHQPDHISAALSQARFNKTFRSIRLEWMNAYFRPVGPQMHKYSYDHQWLNSYVWAAEFYIWESN